ncbi:MAG: DNA polymerase III subunit epsilon [Alphaproteobacteria bacterium]|nr:DNA polymerase III subunit epsilon [Alphaproteobacteria bacterium]
MREICFDTETTGLNVNNGDRLIEIGALELINHIPTGKIFHEYINPEREVPDEVVKVHGITTEFLADKPKFYEIAQKWVDFVGDDGIFVAHNAEFDMRFINFELERCGFPTYKWDRVVDTLAIAKNEFPGARNNLDALCRRFNIDNSARIYHGALLDAELLAEVYLQLLGGDEPSIKFVGSEEIRRDNIKKVEILNRSYELSKDVLQEHRDFLEKNINNPIWMRDEIKKDD